MPIISGAGGKVGMMSIVKEVTVPIMACPTVAGDENLGNAVRKLNTALQAGFPFVVVCDREERPIGFLCTHRVLELFEPEFVVTATWSLPVYWSGFFTDRGQNLDNTPVEEVMQPLDNLPAVATSDPLAKTIHLMLEYKANTLPVLEGETVIGMIHMGKVIERLGLFITDRQ